MLLYYYSKTTFSKIAVAIFIHLLTEDPSSQPIGANTDCKIMVCISYYQVTRSKPLLIILTVLQRRHNAKSDKTSVFFPRSLVAIATACISSLPSFPPASFFKQTVSTHCTTI